MVPAGGPDEFIAYDFATGALPGYPAERLAPVKQEKTDTGPIMPILAPVVVVHQLLNRACRRFLTFSATTSGTTVGLMVKPAF